MGKFKILSLDGGGMRGIISAIILKAVEEQLQKHKGKSLVEYFDLIAGTSTGSILAAGIATKMSLEDIIDIYRQEGKEIFPDNLLSKSISKLQQINNEGLNQTIFPLYDKKGLTKVLKKYFKDIRLKEVGKNTWGERPQPILLVLAYDTLYRNTTFFSNYHPNSTTNWIDDQFVWQICLSSASAPTFFAVNEMKNVEKNGELREEWSYPHVDGGVSANNPSLCALAHAIKHCKVPLEDISLLSLGTGEDTTPYEAKTLNNFGAIEWAKAIVPFFMNSRSEIDSTICEALMGGKKSNRYLRLQFPLNEIFARPKNYLAHAPLLKKPVNKWTQEKIDTNMSNSTEHQLKILSKIADKYLHEGYTFETRYERGLKVKEGIERFIKEEPQEIFHLTFS